MYIKKIYRVKVLLLSALLLSSITAGHTNHASASRGRIITFARDGVSLARMASSVPHIRKHKMSDEISRKRLTLSTDDARALVAEQFPSFSSLTISETENPGWDNVTFRLGDEMSLRFPSGPTYATKVAKEHFWLPRLLPHLPFQITKPIALGQPSEHYPWNWSVYDWIDGEIAAISAVNDSSDFASDVAHFLRSLQGLDTLYGPLSGHHNGYRGGHLNVYDNQMQRALKGLGSDFDVGLASRLWNSARQTSWKRAPVWIHGDMSPGNILVRNRRLCGVIDFGALGVGDPACDYVLAWTFFTPQAREDFKKALDPDEDTWLRARAWALWKSSIIVSKMIDSNKIEVAQSFNTLKSVLEDPSTF